MTHSAGCTDVGPSRSIQMWGWALTLNAFLIHFIVAVLWVQRCAVMQEKCAQEPEKTVFRNVGPRKFLGALFGQVV